MGGEKKEKSSQTVHTSWRPAAHTCTGAPTLAQQPFTRAPCACATCWAPALDSPQRCCAELFPWQQQGKAEEEGGGSPESPVLFDSLIQTLLRRLHSAARSPLFSNEAKELEAAAAGVAQRRWSTLKSQQEAEASRGLQSVTDTAVQVNGASSWGPPDPPPSTPTHPNSS